MFCCEQVLAKLIVLRFALLPRQLIAFEYGYTKDAFAFREAYVEAIEGKFAAGQKFLQFISANPVAHSYKEKTGAILEFVNTLPFFEISAIDSEYDPFADFSLEGVDGYFLGHHIPEALTPEEDEAAIFYIEDQNSCYLWYNQITDKSLRSLVILYLHVLAELKSGLAEQR